MKEELFKTIYYFESEAYSEFDVIQWAMNQSVGGEAPSAVLKLAALERPEREEVKALFRAAVESLGFVYPAETALGLYRAKLVADSMLAGKIPPAKGNILIAKIGREYGWPDLLAGFRRTDRETGEAEGKEQSAGQENGDSLEAVSRLAFDIKSRLQLG